MTITDEDARYVVERCGELALECAMDGLTDEMCFWAAEEVYLRQWLREPRVAVHSEEMLGWD